MRVLKRIKRRWRWLAAFIFLLWLLLLAADRLWPLPLHEVTPARVVVAEDGTPLWRFADAQGVWRYPVTLADVSPRYLQALIHYEDRWFWDHPGVNPLSIARAAWQDLTSGRVISGGSTLTMQVARLLDPHPRTFGGKLRQLWRALQLEWHLSKSEILTLYLNRRRRAAYARTAGPSGRRRRAIKCCCGCKARACGRKKQCVKLSKNPYGFFRARCRSWRRCFPAARWRAAARRRW